MPDDAMFAPFPTGGGAGVPAGATARPKQVPIVPVPADAPQCTWRHPKHGLPVARWPYHDANGRLLGYAARVEFVGEDGERYKDVLPITYCRIAGERCRWRARALPAPRTLYRLPELIADLGAPVVVTEGEKKADLVPSLFPGYVGTTSMGGAGAARHSDWAPLTRRKVIIWLDHDEPGRRYAHDVAALATAADAASVAIVAVPTGWPHGWDIADPLPDGADTDALAELLQSAIPWTPAATPKEPNSEGDAAAEIARLAKLPLIEYGRERKAAAQRLGCSSVAILDKAVAAERGNGGAVAGRGRPLDLPEPEPWPEPIDGAALLTDLAAAIRRHLVLGGAEADAVALWVAAVHAFNAWPIFPRLFINSPEKGCGKSTLLDVLSHLIPKPLGASSITPAALFRVIEAARPTLLLDEADSYARDNEDLRGVLDAGHRRDGAVIRTVGDDHEPRRFSAWAPVALAAIGRLPGTIEDRSVRIGLRRRRPDEAVEPLRLDRTGELETLARKAARWAGDHAAEFAAADPAMPDGIINRAADNWRPLLSVADLARGDWPERARRAAAELSAEGDDQGNIWVALLTDIRAAFVAKAVDRLSSDELAAYLGSLDDRPWPDYRAGKAISKTQVARLLKPFGISSGTIRLPDNNTPKGYHLTAFQDAFARYLPAENATTPQPQDFRGSTPDFKTPHRDGCGVSEIPGMASVSAACGGVADRTAPPDENEFSERAGIIEYDGGYTRTEAERRARVELIQSRWNLDGGWA